MEETPPLFALLNMGAKEEGTWLDSDRLRSLNVATNEISSLEGVLEAISFTGVQVLQNSSLHSKEAQLQLLSIADSLDSGEKGSLSVALEQKKWRKYIAEHPLLRPRLISKDGRSVVISIQQEVVSKHGTKKLKQEVKRILAEKFPYTTVQIGGQPAIQVEISSLLSRELAIFFSISIVVMGFTLFLIFSNMVGFLTPLYITIMANIASLSWLSYMGIPFSVLSSSLPILINITVVSMCIHTMLRFSRECRKHSSELPFKRKWEAIKKTQKALFLPNILTSLTTCVGFITLYTADVPLISQYSSTVCFGIMVSWLASNILLIPALILTNTPITRAWTRKGTRWSIHVMNRAKPIFICLTLLLLAMFSISDKKNWTALLLDAVPITKESRIASEFINDNMGASIPLSLVIDAKEKHAWNYGAHIRKKDELVKKWRKEEDIGSVVSLVDFLGIAHQNMKPDKKELSRLPASRAAISEIYFLYSLSGESVLDRFMSGEGRYARISIFLDDVPDSKAASIVEKLKDDTKKMFPGYDVKAMDMASTVHPVNRQISLTLINSFWVSILLISILLLFVFRSLRLVLLAAIPNLFPPLMLLSSMYLFGTAMRPSTAIIFAIAIGLAFNNTTYLIGRLRSFLKKRNENRNLIDRTLYLEGTTCFLSTLPLMAGFIVFAFSEFEINRLFGAYMLISIFASLIGDLLFLPSILKTFPGILDPLMHNYDKNKDKKESVILKKLVPTGRFAVTFIITFIVINIFSEIAVPVNKPNSSIQTAKQILKLVDENIQANDERAVIAMETRDKNGNKKSSTLKIWRKNRTKSHKILVEVIEPNDNRGIKLLSIDESKSRSQWIFFPSSNKVRRIISNGQGQGFMGSELSYEDLGGFSDRFKSKLEKKITKKNKEYAIIESTPIKSSSYSKIRTWVSLPEYLVHQVKYYDKKNKLLKVSEFSNYKKFKRKTWRAINMTTTNVQNKRITELNVKKLAVLNKGISDQIFSLSNLEEN